MPSDEVQGLRSHDDSPIARSIRRDAIKAWREQAKSALAQMAVHGIVIFFGGIFCILVAELIKAHIHSFSSPPNPPPSEFYTVILNVIEEIGTGLIVAAIAVFGYEILDKIFKSTDDKMQEEEMYAQLVAATQKIKISSDPIDAIRDLLAEVFHDSQHKEFRDNVYELIKNGERIVTGKELLPERASYLNYIAWITKRVAVSSSYSLQNLIYSLTTLPGGAYGFVPLESREIAQNLLAAQMNSMAAGDSYDSITYFPLYIDDIGHYISATENALRRGVQIRRIFNICAYEAPNGAAAAPCDDEMIKNIVQDQVRLQKEYPNSFAIRFFGNAAIPFVDKNIIKDPEISWLQSPEDVRDTYYGLFRHEGGRTLLFRGQPADVSKIKLSCYHNEETSGDRGNLSRLFENIWRLSSTKNPFEVDRFDQNWMNTHVAALAAAKTKKQESL